MATTNIEWAMKVWNPTTGCNKVSAGCKNCYAEKMHKRLIKMNPSKYTRPFLDGAFLHDESLAVPFKWKKPTTVFVNSMSDLFHESLSIEDIAKAYAVMFLTERHTYQILTKRPDIREGVFVSDDFFYYLWQYTNSYHSRHIKSLEQELYQYDEIKSLFPFKNIWEGTSVEDQETATPIPQLTKGPLTLKYEQAYATTCGRKYAVFVNSGSSANLLTIYALIATKRLKNNKIVVSDLSWITTISPIMQLGLQPILCDINLKDLSVCCNNLERIFQEQQPACLFLVSVLGLVPDMDRITALCRKYEVMLVMDNCESQGSRYKDKDIQQYGVMSTCSSYFGHITSTIEGGTIVTDDEELYNTLKMNRSHGWDRDIDEGKQQQLRTAWQVTPFNSRYTFYDTGFNLRNNDLGAFLGLRQLTRLPAIIKARNKNYEQYHTGINNKYWKAETHGYVSSLGYPILHPNRDKIIAELDANSIEHRPLIAGALGTQPFYITAYGRNELINSTISNAYGFYIPNHPMLTEADIQRVCGCINKYM